MAVDSTSQNSFVDRDSRLRLSDRASLSNIHFKHPRLKILTFIHLPTQHNTSNEELVLKIFKILSILSNTYCVYLTKLPLVGIEHITSHLWIFAADGKLQPHSTRSPLTTFPSFT